MWPAIFAFTERHLLLSERVCSLYSFLSGIVSLVIPLILGQVFNSWPLILFYLEALFIIISLILFVIVKVWIISTKKSWGLRMDNDSEHSHIY